jgi:acetolactate synthase-1/2/3 large subunit
MNPTSTHQSLFPPPPDAVVEEMEHPSFPPPSAVRPSSILPRKASPSRFPSQPPSSRSAPPVRMAVVDALLGCLEDEGVDRIFGVPGAALTPIYESVAKGRRIQQVLAKHEEGAAFMAASYAQVKHSLGVCCATSGPGATNAVTGIASAYADSLPVLLLTGQSSTRYFGKGAFQESSSFGIDTVQLFKPITKMSVMIPSPDRIMELLQHAIRVALSGRPGPVHLSLPADFLRHSIEVTRRPPGQYRASGATLDRAAIEAVADLLVRAERPAILAGHGVNLADAAPELARLAERLHIPVATSPKGKGAFPENSPLSLGVFGFAGHLRAEDYLLNGGVDVLLVVGTSLGEWTTNSWNQALVPSQAFVQIDVDPSVLGRNYPIDVGVVGDARAALSELYQQVETLLEREVVLDRHPDPLRALRAEVPRFVDLDEEDEGLMLKPTHLVRELRATLPDDALLFIDMGNAITWGGHYFEARKPNTYFVSLGLASMGSALAGAIGGKLASPSGRPVVALVGDGAFAMNGMEVHTAVEHDVPVIWVVLNNAGHGMIKHGETLLLGRHLNACEFRAPLDIYALAIAMGATAFRVHTRDELRAALDEALKLNRPCVIDAIIDADVIPCSLARRARAVKAAFAEESPARPKVRR